VTPTEQVDRFQRRHPAAGFPIAVLYKYVDDQGAYLAALLTYYGFVSLFPLLLLLSTVLGFVLVGDAHLQQEVLHSAVSQFPVIGEQLNDPQRIGGGTAGLFIGILGSLYGSLGFAQALQNAMNIAWAIPRNERPNPLKSRGRGLLLLATVGAAILAAAALAAASSRIGASGSAIGEVVKLLLVLAAVVVNAAIFVVAFRIATARDLTVRQVAPGAVAAAVVWQLLQTFGAAYVNRVVRHASDTNSVFALVLGLLAFLYLASVAIVVCVEVNVVRVGKLHPRALLTPFTDNVDLTSGDRDVYTGQAEAQQTKGFEDVDVTFGTPPHRETDPTDDPSR
jgi:membrane protein